MSAITKHIEKIYTTRASNGGLSHTPLSAVGGIAGAADTDLFCA